MGTQKNRLIDNICFGLEFDIILGVHSSHLLLICSSELPFFDWDSYFLKEAIYAFVWWDSHFLSTHNICFGLELKKYFFWYTL